MPPRKKFTSVRRRKRKFTGNIYTRKRNSEEIDAAVEEKTAEKSEDSDIEGMKPLERTRSSDRATFKSMPASVRKLGELPSDSSDSSSEDELEGTEGFRFIDISVLASVFKSRH